MPQRSQQASVRSPKAASGSRRRERASATVASAGAPTPLAVLQQFRELFRVSQRHFQRIEARCGLGGAQLWALSEVGKRPGLTISGACAPVVHPSLDIQQRAGQARSAGADPSRAQEYGPAARPRLRNRRRDEAPGAGAKARGGHQSRRPRQDARVDRSTPSRGHARAAEGRQCTQCTGCDEAARGRLTRLGLLHRSYCRILSTGISRGREPVRRNPFRARSKSLARFFALAGVNTSTL